MSGIVATGTVGLTIAAPFTGPHRRVNAPSLPLCIASALMTQLGAPLAISHMGSGRPWHATATLDLALQPDFFAAGA